MVVIYNYHLSQMIVITTLTFHNKPLMEFTKAITIYYPHYVKIRTSYMAL